MGQPSFLCAYVIDRVSKIGRDRQKESEREREQVRESIQRTGKSFTRKGWK